MKLAVLTNYKAQLDAEGRINITHLWKTAGAKYKKDPNTWKANASSKEYIAHIQAKLNTQNSGSLTAPVLTTKRGRTGGGTFAHPLVALAYAKFVSVALHAFVNETFFEAERERLDPNLKAARAIEGFRKQGKTEDWIAARLKSIQGRNLLTKLCEQRGVSGEGFRHITNATYTGLFGGTASDIRRDRGLPEKANLRAHLETFELRATEFTEAMSAERIRKNSAYGEKRCSEECLAAGVAVRQMIEQQLG